MVQCELSGSAAIGVSVQVALLKVPVPVPARLKLTVPDGLDLVPEAVSSTWTSQVLAWLRATVLGAQVTVVLVLRAAAKLTVMLAFASYLHLTRIC